MLYFIDDFHLLKDDRAATFLCRMAGRIPENVHLIVASRNHFISDDWIVRLGGRLHRIEIDDLRLNAGGAVSLYPPLRNQPDRQPA